MSLFPAYSLSSENVENINNEFSVVVQYFQEPTESQLLASDSEDERTTSQLSKPSPKVSATSDVIQSNDFYSDCKPDRGNLCISTLYYPGRPQYDCQSRSRAVGELYERGVRESRKRRYYTKRPPDEPEAPAIAQRVDAYRLLIAQMPNDISLWEKFIDFQEICAGGVEAALKAAEEAAVRVPGSGRLRTRLLVAMRSALPLHEYLERLRNMLAKETSVEIRLELWERLLRALAVAPGADAAQLTSATAAAVSDTRAAPDAYSRLIYVHGSYLADAGLWERLVLLIEVVVGMNFASAALPVPELELLRQAEARLTDTEDKAIESGLPLSAVWVRVERARAAAHWRAAALSEHSLDPQRTPLPHDIADLLLPVTSDDALFQLSVRLLLLVKVPFLPGTSWISAAACGVSFASGGEAFLPLVRAAACLPPAHPTRLALQPELATRALALLLDPPHYFTDDTGFLSWVNGVWDVCCERARGSARVALVCWRLRWLCALLSLATQDALGRKEAARIRAEAKALLHHFKADSESPLPFAEFAFIERLAAGSERALRVATQALRAATLDGTCPPHHALYVARTVCELSSSGSAQLSEEGACALVCAVLQRAPPARLAAPAPCDLQAALQRCEQQCNTIEKSLTSSGSSRLDADMLLPGAGEWSRARALLAPPWRRQELVQALRAQAPSAVANELHEASRYYEESAEALCATAAREGHGAATAGALATIFPDNAYCALARSGTMACAWADRVRGAQGVEERLRALYPCGAMPALAALLPLLLHAVKADSQPKEAEALARMSRRITRGGAELPALLWTLRLEAEARAPSPNLPAALYAALDAAPQHKWLYVRGAAWCGSEAGTMADALLERSLRLHTLPDELRPAMDRTMYVTLLAALLLLLRPPAALPHAADLDDDADSDHAAYMIVLEHDNGWQCAASLISLRTGVTTALCGRGPAHSRGVLWALAAALLSDRPPAPLSAAARRVSRVALAGDGRDPMDPAHDIAVVELEEPFGVDARSRPILMATTGEGCRSASECHAIHALPPLGDAGPRRARFRVVSLAQGREDLCAERVAHWRASHSRLLCFVSDQLCERDLGGGVVCGGRLCGVLSMVAGVVAAEAGAGAGEGRCADTLAAQEVARWRRFLHCAHTLRLCGRGTCATVCSEHRLLDDDESSAATPARPLLQTSSELIILKVTATSFGCFGEKEEETTRVFLPSVEFEPNRADFKVTPSRTSRVALKAGEYGDNAADYSAEETPPAPAPVAIPSPRPTRTDATPPSPSTPQVPRAPALRAAPKSTTSSGYNCSRSKIVNIFLAGWLTFLS